MVGQINQHDFLKLLQVDCAEYLGEKISLEDLDIIIKCISALIAEQTAKGEEVNIINLGKFSRVWKKERIGMHPRKPEQIVVEGQWTPKFRRSSVWSKYMREMTSKKNN